MDISIYLVFFIKSDGDCSNVFLFKTPEAGRKENRGFIRDRLRGFIRDRLESSTLLEKGN